MMEMLESAVFWVALAQIFGITIILSGDKNVVAVPMSRGLPSVQRKRANLFQSLTAIPVRIVQSVVSPRTERRHPTRTRNIEPAFPSLHRDIAFFGSGSI